MPQSNGQMFDARSVGSLENSQQLLDPVNAGCLDFLRVSKCLDLLIVSESLVSSPIEASSQFRILLPKSCCSLGDSAPVVRCDIPKEV